MSSPPFDDEYSNSVYTDDTEFEDYESSFATQVVEESLPEQKLGLGDTQVIPSPSDQGKPPECCERYLGVLYTIYGIFMTSLGSIVLYSLSHVHPITIGLYSFPVGIFTSSLCLLHRYAIQKKSLMENLSPMSQNKKVIFFMWVRSTATAMLTFSLAWLAPFTSHSDYRSIYATYVLTVTISGWFLFNEKFGIVTSVVSFLVVCGVVVMTKSPFLFGGEDSNLDLPTIHSVALGAMIFVSVNMLVLRYLKHIYHGVRNTFLFTWAFFATIPFAIALNKTTIPNCTAWDVAAIAGYGVLLALNNSYFAHALKMEDAGVVALVRTCEFVLACFWKVMLRQLTMDWISLLGAALTTSGLIVVVTRIWLRGMAEDNPVRRRLKWFLL